MFAGVRRDSKICPDSSRSPVTHTPHFSTEHAVEGESLRNSDRSGAPLSSTRVSEGGSRARRSSEQEPMYKDSEEERLHRRRSSTSGTPRQRSRSISPYSPRVSYEVCSSRTKRLPFAFAPYRHTSYFLMNDRDAVHVRRDVIAVVTVIGVVRAHHLLLDLAEDTISFTIVTQSHHQGMDLIMDDISETPTDTVPCLRTVTGTTALLMTWRTDGRETGTVRDRLHLIGGRISHYRRHQYILESDSRTYPKAVETLTINTLITRYLYPGAEDRGDFSVDCLSTSRAHSGKKGGIVNLRGRTMLRTAPDLERNLIL